MQRDEVFAALRGYIAQEILDGRDIGLDGQTPLLAWGIINSLEIVRLLSFIRERFGIEIPFEQVSADFFKDIDSLTELVIERAQAQPAA